MQEADGGALRISTCVRAKETGVDRSRKRTVWKLPESLKIPGNSGTGMALHKLCVISLNHRIRAVPKEGGLGQGSFFWLKTVPGKGLSSKPLASSMPGR